MNNDDARKEYMANLQRRMTNMTPEQMAEWQRTQALGSVNAAQNCNNFAGMQNMWPHEPIHAAPVQQQRRGIRAWIARLLGKQ